MILTLALVAGCFAVCWGIIRSVSRAHRRIPGVNEPPCGGFHP